MSIQLVFTGDICLTGYDLSLNSNLIFKETISKIKSGSDLLVGNLECSLLTDKEEGNQNKISLGFAENMIPALSDFEVLSLANNHISDYGTENVWKIQTRLQSQNIATVGFGDNIFNSRKPHFYSNNNLSIGFLAYSCLTTNGENYATTDRPGVSPISLKYLYEDINQIRKTVDHVILLLHWGEEGVHYPTPEQIIIAHRAIDYGASIVIGTHPHAIQGIESYKSGIICYSLGNFLFKDIVYQVAEKEGKKSYQILLSKVNREGIIPRIELTKNAALINSLYYYTINNDIPNICSEKELTVNVSEISRAIQNFSVNNIKMLQNEHEIVYNLKFNGRIFQNRYQNFPITNENKPDNHNLLSKVKSLFNTNNKGN